MYEYAPWSRKELKSILGISSYTLPILDIQLGGACNLNCIYCDTPKYHAKCHLDIGIIKKMIETESIKWVYVCGLGEPTARGNVEIFKQILATCKACGVKVSVFSNIVNLDDELLEYIACGTLHILFKLDTFIPETMSFLYGKDKSEIILANYKKLTAVVRHEDGTTNLAASIVPTKQNYHELRKIVDFCMENGIFPLLGQLENAGKCSEIYDNLCVDDERLHEIKDYIEEKYQVTYSIPVCPATISSVHITNTNDVIVDTRTGLSCPWFWMDEPSTTVVGNIREYCLEELTQKIIQYRKDKYSDVFGLFQKVSSNPFGGCGGDVYTLLSQYLEIAKY